MHVSEYFRRAFTSDQNEVSSKCFEDRILSLFHSDSTQSWIDFVFDGGYSALTEPTSLVLSQDSSSAILKRGKQAQQLSQAVEFATWCSESKLREEDISATRKLYSININNDDLLEQAMRLTQDRNRFIHIRQRNSFSRLSITKHLFDRTLQLSGIFDQFRDFAICFDIKSEEHDVGPPNMRYRLLYDEQDSREPRGFECAYILRLVELNNRPGNDQPWSLRQFALYHQYDFQRQKSTWLSLALTRRCESTLKNYMRGTLDMSRFSPFEIHLLLLDTAVANWRPYLIWLHVQVAERAACFVVSSLEDDSLVPMPSPADRQRLKQLEDNVLDLVVVLASTMDTIISFQTMYQSPGYKLVSSDSSASQDPILNALDEKRREIAMLQTKVGVLRAKIDGAIELVSTLLDLSNGHNLQALAEESKSENSVMRQLAERGFRDAVAVKVLTIITLIYLPTTVVANFFSTQFVGQESNEIGTANRLTVASNWWILVAASTPLTILTIYVWWFYVQREVYGKSPEWFSALYQALSAVVHCTLNRQRGRHHNARDNVQRLPRDAIPSAARSRMSA